MNLIKGLALTFGSVMIMAAAVACSDNSQLQIPGAPTVSISPGAVQSVAPGVVRSISPGAVQSVAPGVVRSISPGAVQSVAPGVVQSISPGAVQSVAPVLSGSMIPRSASAEDLIVRSQIIVVGTLAENFEEIMIGGYGPDGQASTDPEGAMAYTDYRVNIEEVIKGDDTVSAGTESFVFRMFGHINVQKIAPTSVLFKLPEPGDRLLFALGRNPDGTYGSGPEGLIDIESEAAVYEDGTPFASGGTTAELLAQIKAGVSE